MRKLAIQRMELLPVPRTTTILPPPFTPDDTWEALPALHHNESDDFGGSDPTEWADSFMHDDPATIPVPRAANE